MLGGSQGGKAPFAVAATDAAIAQGIKAGDLVSVVGKYVGGKGGGKPALAQGSGTTPDGFHDAFEAVARELSEK